MTPPSTLATSWTCPMPAAEALALISSTFIASSALKPADATK